jgi:hypothetical protein
MVPPISQRLSNSTRSLFDARLAMRDQDIDAFFKWFATNAAALMHASKNPGLVVKLNERLDALNHSLRGRSVLAQRLSGVSLYLRMVTNP